MRKRWCCLALVLFALLSLSACGGPSPASEAQLREDLSEQLVFVNDTADLDVTISNLEIIKRQTTEADKVDQVWICANVSGPRVEGKMYYCMIYKLYNDGWLLETVEKTDIDKWNFSPICGVSDTDIRSYLPENAEVVSNEIDLETALQTVTYTYEESYRYCDIIYKQKLIFGFGTDYYGAGIWSVRDRIDAGTSESWKIDGTWMAKSEGETSGVEEYKLTISGFAPAGIAYDSDINNDSFDVSGTFSYARDARRYLESYFGGPVTEFGKTYNYSDEDGMLSATARVNADGEAYYVLRAHGEMWQHDPSLIESQQHIHNQWPDMEITVSRNEITVDREVMVKAE